MPEQWPNCPRPANTEWRYLPGRGRVVHCLENANEPFALCGAGPLTGAADWRGTGSQDEYEKAAQMRMCRFCAQKLGMPGA